MSIARELYRLQEIDQELAANEKARARIIEQLADVREIAAVETQLTAQRTRFDGYNHDQRKLEHEIDDISTKLSKFEEELYSGRTSNTKELSGLQHEIEILKEQKSGLEDRELELMELIEELSGIISGLESELTRLQAAKEDQKKQLGAELKGIETLITGLQEKRKSTAAGFDAQSLNVYETLKKQRGTAVAKVERGICSGCRISLPVGELQQVRGGNMVRCGSCGRILLIDQ